MKITVRRQLWLKLIDYCGSAYPAEACGFVIGDADPDTGAIMAQDIAPVRNVAPIPQRQFEMDPAELISRLAETPPERLIGVFHSHPRSAAVPSESDLQTDWHTLPSYWIVSLQAPASPQLGLYRLDRRAGRTVPVPIPYERTEDSD